MSENRVPRWEILSAGEGKKEADRLAAEVQRQRWAAELASQRPTFLGLSDVWPDAFGYKFGYGKGEVK